MNGKLASLIADRAHHALDEALPADWRFLVRSVFPLISSASHRGSKRTAVAGLLNDKMFNTLRDMGYVVRHDDGTKMTTIEWCDQAVMNGSVKPELISPTEFNRRQDDYQRYLAGI